MKKVKPIKSLSNSDNLLPPIAHGYTSTRIKVRRPANTPVHVAERNVSEPEDGTNNWAEDSG